MLENLKSITKQSDLVASQALTNNRLQYNRFRKVLDFWQNAFLTIYYKHGPHKKCWSMFPNHKDLSKNCRRQFISEICWKIHGQNEESNKLRNATSSQKRAAKTTTTSKPACLTKNTWNQHDPQLTLSWRSTFQLFSIRVTRCVTSHFMFPWRSTNSNSKHILSSSDCFKGKSVASLFVSQCGSHSNRNQN